MKAVIFGATKGMGRSLARLIAERGASLVLLGRNLQDLESSARDLEARGAHGKVGTIECALNRPSSFRAALQSAQQELGGLDTVIITAAVFATQDALEEDGALCADLLYQNFTTTILFCEQARKLLLQSGGGTLCVFSSVAGERARKPVILYGATKAGLSYYLEGLDHKFRSQGLRVVTVKPGFVRTSMTASLPEPPFAGEPDAVAKRVLRAIDKGTPVVYAPPIWALVMFVIRWLPRFVMRKIKF